MVVEKVRYKKSLLKKMKNLILSKHGCKLCNILALVFFFFFFQQNDYSFSKNDKTAFIGVDALRKTLHAQFVEDFMAALRIFIWYPPRKQR